MSQTLDILGRNEELRRAGVVQRLRASENPYPLGWSPRASYYPTEQFALLGDVEGVRAAIKDYEENTPPDAFDEAIMHYRFARLFAYLGDVDGSFEYLERIERAVGPARFPLVSLDPAFDSIRDDPRYGEMQTAYEAWAKD